MHATKERESLERAEANYRTWGDNDGNWRPCNDPLKDVSQYEKLGRIGEGTFGVVYKARERSTGALVALKRVRMDREKEGMPVTSLRELTALQQLKHPNIVRLLDVVPDLSSNSVFLVFEYVEHDMNQLMDHMRKPFSPSEIKQLMLQLLSAVEYMHRRWVVHRDLKVSNLLYSNSGNLLVADMGLARAIGTPQGTAPLSPVVVTLWYRDPALLFGKLTYGPAVDMWSVGCIMGELLLHAPLLPGSSEMDQMHLICNLLGTPTSAVWPEMDSLPNAKVLNLPFQPYNNLSHKLKTLSPTGLDLIGRMLRYDPQERITAAEALCHPFFTESPLPLDKSMMPTFPTIHDSMLRREREKRRTEPTLDKQRFDAFEPAIKRRKD